MKSENFVEIVVIKQLSYGLQVQIKGDGRKGIIHKREISWDGIEIQKWREIFPVGYQDQAIILHDQKDRALELSIRLAKNDPWNFIHDHFSNGDHVEGVVLNTKSFGAYIYLSDGITGLLHRSKLPVWEKREIPDIFWPGDYVLVQIMDIDQRNRKISLGIVNNKDILFDKLINPVLQNTDDRSKVFHQQYHFDVLNEEEQLRIILAYPNHNNSLTASSFFQNIGHHVDIVLSSKDCIGLLMKEMPDLVLIDFDIPDINGIELIKTIKSKFPSVDCALAIDMDKADRYGNDMEELNNENISILINPLQTDDLIELHQKHNKLHGQSEQIKKRASYSITSLLEKCRRVTKFDIAVLFSLNNNVVKVEARRGTIPDSGLTDDLVYSPVRDVAERDDYIFVDNFEDEKNKDKYKYLQNYYPFSSCLGMRVPVVESTKYALFLFGSEPRTIYDDEVTYLQATVLMISSHLEKKLIFERVTTFQKTALLGQMTGMMTHELNYKLGFFSKVHGQLSEQLDILEKDVKNGKNVTMAVLCTLKENLSILENKTINMNNYLNACGRIRSFTGDEAILVKEIIKETLILLKERTNKEHININFMYNKEEMIIIRGNAPQIQQVIVNLLVNAIELISETRRGQGGNIWLDITKTKTQSLNSAIKIIISDDGPGIHYRNWEKIFGLGFTTRQGGSGLGLYISHGIIENMSGRLYVLSSFILGGTAFVIELPDQI